MEVPEKSRNTGKSKEVSPEVPKVPGHMRKGQMKPWEVHGKSRKVQGSYHWGQEIVRAHEESPGKSRKT
jgi:hypothetical protein